MNTFANRALFSRVCGSDIASFDGVVLVSFVAQVRSTMFYDSEVPGACRGESFVVVRRPNNACYANYLDVTRVRGPYCGVRIVLVNLRSRWPHACHP